jgi:hypothetical protein
VFGLVIEAPAGTDESVRGLVRAASVILDLAAWTLAGSRVPSLLTGMRPAVMILQIETSVPPMMPAHFLLLTFTAYFGN